MAIADDAASATKSAEVPDIKAKASGATKEIPPEATPTTGGLLKSIQTVFGLFLTIIHSRLDLFASELELERRRLLSGLIFGTILIVSAVAAFFTGLLFVIVLAWMFHVLLILLGVTFLVLVITGLVMFLKLRVLYSQREKFFYYTLEELRKDIVGLRRAMGPKKGV